MLNNQTTLLYWAKDLGQDKKQADIKEMEIKDFQMTMAMGLKATELSLHKNYYEKCLQVISSLISTTIPEGIIITQFYR